MIRIPELIGIESPKNGGNNSITTAMEATYVTQSLNYIYNNQGNNVGIFVGEWNGCPPENFTTQYQKLVSVIIPIHNTAKYLKKCLNSVIKQTYTNLEIILINDGSTDNSASIIDKFAKKDARIKVFTNQVAQGVSSARNIGLENASGEYINFIDGDDWVTKDAISSLVNLTCGGIFTHSFCDYFLCLLILLLLRTSS